jgi:CRP/FNR family transcriptional regulator, cyclic AMP receptor protein
MEQCRFAAGHEIFAEGDPSDVAYIITAGSVEILKTASSGEVLLAVLRAGEIFGEMGLVDEAPRSATARAAGPVVATLVERDEFLELLQSRSEQGTALLRTLFERLRTTNQLLVAERESRDFLRARQTSPCRVQVLASTPRASRALPGSGILVERFPLRIGRKPHGIGESMLACNDVEFDDAVPYRVSLNHMAIDLDRGAVVVRDRGSQHGIEVNGTRIGGDDLWTTLALSEGRNEVVLGPAGSPFRLAVDVAVAA